MKTITIRGLDAEASEKIKKAAAKQNKSINQFVLELIRTNLGLEKEKQYTREYNDLDHLFGSWRDDEYRQIQDKIDRERRIDQEMWE